MAKTEQTESYHLRLPLSLKKKVKALCTKEQRTFQNMMLRLVEKGIAKWNAS